ncbi:uncharacterized protein Ecym_6471 [Eremothecium cymbalariae DBVPG|uniref:Altered inheritance of mitochondria protein 6 n=1 Tax=Eremothecium cymbalariae (strain CBS 270.75 / DBVPG 7215 / KCTC 17166 / NRRL Y-17582) TaxID=931890 RepID=G8JUR2_ERECY|nr:hypothetical protein Ecym_6471 [Eremothecium cymbalariae DBVPG\
MLLSHRLWSLYACALVLGVVLTPQVLVAALPMKQRETVNEELNGLTGASLTSYFSDKLNVLKGEYGSKGDEVLLSTYYDTFQGYLDWVKSQYVAVDVCGCPVEGSEKTLSSKLTENVPVRDDIHSHNDYTRVLPLYTALSHGVNSVEADIWTVDNGQRLAVGHLKSDITPRTPDLNQLYLDPIKDILGQLNDGLGEGTWLGVFHEDSSKPLQLLLDFKSADSVEQYHLLMNTYLKPLIDKGYLGYYDFATSKVVTGPVMVVLTGNFPTSPEELDGGSQDGYFNDKRRYVFPDVPLVDLESAIEKYGPVILASDSLFNLLSHCGSAMPFHYFLTNLTNSEETCIRQLTDKCRELGVRSRIWGQTETKATLRDYLLKEEILQLGVDYHNVDDIPHTIEVINLYKQK